MSKKCNILSALALMLIASAELTGADLQGLIGGNDNSGTPYAAQVFSPGTATELSNFPTSTSGQINSVSINSLGSGIIGGFADQPYAALVSPSGAATTISPLPLLGDIFSVGINSQGVGIIGGDDSSVPYAAFVSPSANATPITLDSTGNGQIFSVAINSSGSGIVGGNDHGSTKFYAALVSPSAIGTKITNLPTNDGRINSVAINSFGSGIIGGQDQTTNSPYAAIVSSSGSATTISLTGFSGTGPINSVAINSLGSGIVGGQDVDNSIAYAALISSSGVATQISPLPTGGNSLIDSVDINSVGSGIVGGRDGSDFPYAALVSSSGSVTPISLTGSTGTGTISSVAINPQGVGLVGGDNQNFTKLYAALVSPSGVATNILNLPTTNGSILSVDLIDAILEETVPTSFGPQSSYANPLFAFSTQILSNHLLALKYPNDPQNLIDIALLADASDVYNECEPICSPCCPQSSYSLWLSPLLYNAHQKKQGNNPELTNWAAGAMVGFDYYGFQNAIFGVGAAYAFDYVHLFDGIGHAKINEEFITLYGASRWEHFYINASLWGGLYQVDNERHTLGIITSKSDYDGWLFLPHLEMSFPFYAKDCWFLIDPFVMFDWANNWQSHIHEKGSAGFNLIIGNQYTSLLRSEAGLRFFQSLQYCWGTFVLMEKASYVNKLPFHAGTSSAIFVAGTAPFGVEMFTNRTQNLGVGQFEMTFVPNNSKYPYGSINYQGEFGSTFQSHLVAFEVGKEF